MRLATVHDLELPHRARDLRQLVEVREDEIRALVRRRAAREADRHHRRIEELTGAPRDLGEQGALAGRVRLADLLERYANGIPQIQIVAPPLRHPPVEQLRELRTGPRHRVHAVGDRVHRILREHPARHVAVAHRHAVHEAREVQREVRHVQHPLVHPARSFQERDTLVAEHVAHHLERELVVAGRHRRVRREDAAVAHRLQIGVVQLEVLPPVELPLEQLQGEQRRVPFIEVVDRLPFDPNRLQQARAPHPEHDLLTQPIVLVATVERVGERLVPLRVLGELGVEEVHRHLVSAHSFHGELPGADVDLAALDRHGAAGVHRLELCLRRPVHGALALLARGVQVLLEIALPVQQRHGDQRHADVGGRAQRVAGQHAEPTAVGGDRLLEADLHREVRDGGSRGGQRHLVLMLVSRDGGHALLHRSVAAMCAGSRLGCAYVVVLRRILRRHLVHSMDGAAGRAAGRRRTRSTPARQRR
jgi:hypothetical protein